MPDSGLRPASLLRLGQKAEPVDVALPHAPKVGSIAKFGFGRPKLELKVAELKPGKLVRWSDAGGFPGWEGTTITWEIAPSKDGGQEVRFSHAGWPEKLPPSELASVNYTWGRVVGRLKKHVETGEVVPYFP